MAVALALCLGVACGTSGAIDPSPPGPDAPPAGTLRAWMRARLAPPLARGEAGGLGTDLRALAELAPPGYDEWPEMAERAAAAAARGDLAAVRAECAGCHRTYRRRYRAERPSTTAPPIALGAR